MVHRLDHWPTYVPSLIWGVLAGAGTLTDVVAVEVIFALAASALVLAYGFALNALCDVRSDIRSRSKSNSVAAIQRIGVGRLRAALVSESVIALALSATPYAMTRSGAYLPLVCVGAFIANTVYSAPPVRAKGRSSFGFVAMAIKSGTFPGLFGLAATHALVNPARITLLVAISCCVASRGLWHAIPDTRSDAAAGIKTFSVTHGAIRSGHVSIVLIAIASLATLLSTWQLLGLPLALLACLGMSATVWFRMTALSVAEPSDDSVLTSIASPDNERLNARWNSITFSCLCLASVVHLLTV